MDSRTGRRGFLAAAGAFALAGCAGSPGATAGTGESGDAPGDPPVPTTEALPLPLPPDAIAEQSVSGGVPKDGIPSIDDPSFESADAAAEWLAPGDPVFGVAGESDVKAYPQAILVYHEICNDVVDGESVSVTYCPLTGTALGFGRGETTFGVSGRLVNNNLIMYDRASGTWWPQVLATAVPGDWNKEPPSRSLREFRVVWTTWERWREQHPDTEVLSRDTGHARNYDRDPYGDYNPRRGYYRPEAGPMFGTLGDPDDRYEPKTVFLGARTPAGALAVRKDHLREAGLIEADLGGTPHVVVYDGALDTGHVYRNPARRRVVQQDGEVRVDGTAHPPDGLPLRALSAFDAMWFAWAGFYPDSTVHG